MATTVTKGATRPWDRYRGQKGWQLLEPGWASMLTDGELEYIQRKLQADAALSFVWGFRPGAKMRSEAAIRRVAMYGDPDVRATNIKLARSRSDPPEISDDKAA
jgi:hypothetical protein